MAAPHLPEVPELVHHAHRPGAGWSAALVVALAATMTGGWLGYQHAGSGSPRAGGVTPVAATAAEASAVVSPAHYRATLRAVCRPWVDVTQVPAVAAQPQALRAHVTGVEAAARHARARLAAITPPASLRATHTALSRSLARMVRITAPLGDAVVGGVGVPEALAQWTTPAAAEQHLIRRLIRRAGVTACG